MDKGPSGEPHALRPRIIVMGVGGAGCNAVNNMIDAGLQGVEFVVANTDAQQLALTKTDRRIQLGVQVTEGLGAGAQPLIGAQAAHESLDEIAAHLEGAHMAFITAGMGGGTGTGAAPVIAKCARERGLLTVGVVTKPFGFEGRHRMRIAEAGIDELRVHTDTLIIVPNQNLFRIATAQTTFAEAFRMADEVLHSGVRSVTDLIVLPGLINLDFADVLSVMAGMGDAMMGTGEAEGEGRAVAAAERALENPLLDTSALVGARSVLVNVTGGADLTLLELDEAANVIAEQVDPDANIIFGAAFHPDLDGRIRVSVIATGMTSQQTARPAPQPVQAEPEPLPQAEPPPGVEAEAAPESQPEFGAEAEGEPPEPATRPEPWIAPAAGKAPEPDALPSFLQPQPERPRPKGGWLSRLR